MAIGKCLLGVREGLIVFIGCWGGRGGRRTGSGWRGRGWLGWTGAGGICRGSGRSVRGSGFIVRSRFCISKRGLLAT